jgi:alpha/beta hydrolase fold
MTSLDVDVAQLESVDLAGYRIAYRQWGDRSASDAWVLVHGITSSSLSWIRVAPRLAERARVIAVDLKGHGDSARPTVGYRLADQADEVAGLIKALGVRSIRLVGHSWGGAIAVSQPGSSSGSDPSPAQTELDDENGNVIYSVQLTDGAGNDVKVDTTTGTVSGDAFPNPAERARRDLAPVGPSSGAQAARVSDLRNPLR